MQLHRNLNYSSDQLLRKYGVYTIQNPNPQTIDV